MRRLPEGVGVGLLEDLDRIEIDSDAERAVLLVAGIEEGAAVRGDFHRGLAVAGRKLGVRQGQRERDGVFPGFDHFRSGAHGRRSRAGCRTTRLPALSSKRRRSPDGPTALSTTQAEPTQDSPFTPAPVRLAGKNRLMVSCGLTSQSDTPSTSLRPTMAAVTKRRRSGEKTGGAPVSISYASAGPSRSRTV